MKILAAFFILLIPFSFVACGNPPKNDCCDILYAMTDAEVGLPSGRIYSMRAMRGDEEYLSEHLINSLYGEGGTPVMANGWLDLAVFLPSLDHPCEMAVFLCDSKDSANDTARMLSRRLGSLRQIKQDSEFSYYFESASVTIRGNYVLLVISSDTENAIKSASKIIG